MPLVTTTEMFKKAYEGGYAIGAFNVNNMEIVQGITEAAKELNAPLILQVSKGARAYANHTYLMKLVEAAEIETQLPICLHLDHGDTFETCKSCIDGGFTSVMIDASSKPFAENIEITRKVVEYAHDHGVVVEAELGTLAGIEDEVKVSAEDSSYTHPDVFVYNSDVSGTYSNFGLTTSAFINCIIYQPADNTTNQNFYNCIFVFHSLTYWSLSSSNTCRNCLSVNSTQLFANQMYGGNNWTNANRSEVFSTGYVLTDEAKEKYIGTDGTEIGYYGGSYPYNSKVQYPIVTNFSSDVQTSKEGILNINVEVDGQ